MYTKFDLIFYVTNSHIFTFILHNDYGYPREALQFFVYIPGPIWTKQHLTATLTLNGQWPHDPPPPLIICGKLSSEIIIAAYMVSEGNYVQWLCNF